MRNMRDTTQYTHRLYSAVFFVCTCQGNIFVIVHNARFIFGFSLRELLPFYNYGIVSERYDTRRAPNSVSQPVSQLCMGKNNIELLLSPNIPRVISLLPLKYARLLVCSSYNIIRALENQLESHSQSVKFNQSIGSIV